MNKLKGVFSKPSGNLIVAPIFFEIETSNFEYLSMQSLSQIEHFIKVPTLNFGGLMESKKIRGGALIKYLISIVQSGSNFAQFSKSKNNQLAKI